MNRAGQATDTAQVSGLILTGGGEWTALKAYLIKTAIQFYTLPTKMPSVC